MALHTKNGSYNIPTDAVQLSRDDAVMFMQNIFHNWNTPKDVFYIKYGPGMLSGLAAISGIFLNSHYRNRLRLQSFGRLSMFAPAAVIPAAIAFLTHVKRVQEPIAISELQCSVCMEVRATSLQLVSGMFYPLALTPLAGFMLAVRYHTYNVPSISSDPKSVWNLYVKLTRPLTKTLCFMAGIHVLAAAYITYKEAESVMNVTGKLIELEAEAEERNALDPGST